jgi:Protein of unknown function (DUF2950)
MRVGKLGIAVAGRGTLLKLAAAVVLLAGSFAAQSVGQQSGQKTFSSPEDASKALFAAAKSNDEKAILDLLGAEGKEVVSSGDEAEDVQARANFVKRYEEMSRLVKEPDGTVTLYIGPHNWPFPISLVNKGNVWYFNTTAAKQEILFRRIGRNEVSAIHVCRELVAAQREYYTQHHSEYARKIFSDEGKHDGLYWKPSESEPHSPIGPLVAHAVSGDVKSSGAQPVPFRGYYFHILTSQGKNAMGGAKNYEVDGKMTGGFAFVAYPAVYRSSGVMTFLVSEDGVVYEKDLGKKTESLGMSIHEFNPDSSWHKSEPDQQTASSGKATQ